MTALNSEGLEKARDAFYGGPGKNFANPPVGALETAISAYLAALPPVDGLEVHAQNLRDAARQIDMECAPEESDLWAAAEALSQSSSVIAGLKEANEALMRERTSLIETKREQIERLTKERDEAVDNGHDWFNVSQDRMARIYSLEEENKRLREALAPIAEEADHADLNAGHDGPLGQYVAYDVLCRARQALEDHNG